MYQGADNAVVNQEPDFVRQISIMQSLQKEQIHHISEITSKIGMLSELAPIPTGPQNENPEPKRAKTVSTNLDEMIAHQRTMNADLENCLQHLRRLVG